MLAALGIVAAWNVRHQQATSSEMMAQEVRGLVAIQRLYTMMRDARYQLNQFLRFDESKYLEEIDQQIVMGSKMLEELQGIVPSGAQREKLEAVERGFEAFVTEYRQVRDLGTEQRRAVLTRLADTQITNEILGPAQECVDLNERIVKGTNERNRQITRQLTRGFLLLGLTGSIAGVIMGLVIARGLRRSLWNLHVSVSGAAGRLEEVVGPFVEPRSNDPMDLQSGMKHLEEQITAVVARLQEREREVVRNEQLAAVGRLAAGLAHELRNPLTPMKMLVQTALSRNDSQGLNRRQLSVIDQEITRMEQSIQSFLDFGRPPHLEKRRTDIRPLISNAVDLVSGRSRVTSVEILWEPPADPCELNIDPVQIRQVIVNLLLNALDAVGTQGQVTVSIATAQPSPLGVSLSTSELDLGIIISVADSGPGLPESERDRIFEPFVTTKETGSGLGLSICQRIVKAHSGEISAKNRSTGGAVFQIWLPDTDLAPVDVSRLVPYLE